MTIASIASFWVGGCLYGLKLIGNLPSFSGMLLSKVLMSGNVVGGLSCKVGLKVGFKPTKQVYKPVSNKNSANTSSKKKQAELSRQEGSLAVAPGSSSTTPIAERIDKLEKQILDGKLMFVDNEGKSLYKANSTINVDSDSEVEEVYSETVVDDDYDPNDDDMYDGHDMFDNLHAICDDLYTKVRG
ncbi:hypothetical protein Tco_1224167 [Tanacetum coccineum]